MKKIERKDLIYWVIILVGINVFVITGRLSSDTTLLNYISFAGTLVSIILAVVAIIYSYYQSSTFENTSHILKDSANSVSQVTKELKSFNLDNMTSEIKDTIDTVNNRLTELDESLSHINGNFIEISNSLDEHVNIVQSGIGDMRENINSFSLKAETLLNLNTNKKDEKNLKNIEVIDTLSVTSISFFYYLYKSNSKPKINEYVDLILDSETNVTPWNNDTLNKIDRNNLVNLLGGFYIGLIQLGNNNNWFKFSKGEILQINEEFIKALLYRINIEDDDSLIKYSVNLIDNNLSD